jgi:hypothetical protein
LIVLLQLFDELKKTGLPAGCTGQSPVPTRLSKGQRVALKTGTF